MTDYSALSDDDLASLLRAENEHAFNEIYDRYWVGVFLVARNRLKNDAEAEEIVQNIFYALWRKKETFILEKNFKTYFAVAVKYEIINYTVKRRREATFVNNLPLFDVDNSTIETLNYNELKLILEKSLCLLPERCQLVFRLRVEKGYTQKQIANELKISEKTVEAHISKARKQLVKTIEPAVSTHVFLLITTLFL